MDVYYLYELWYLPADKNALLWLAHVYFEINPTTQNPVPAQQKWQQNKDSERSSGVTFVEFQNLIYYKQFGFVI